MYKTVSHVAYRLPCYRDGTLDPFSKAYREREFYVSYDSGRSCFIYHILNFFNNWIKDFSSKNLFLINLYIKLREKGSCCGFVPQ